MPGLFKNLVAHVLPQIMTLTRSHELVGPALKSFFPGWHLIISFMLILLPLCLLHSGKQT